MPDAHTDARNNQTSTSTPRKENLNSESTNRRYTEGSIFRDRPNLETDVRSNSSVDLSPRSRRQNSLSDDFQDSIHFSQPPQRTMSLTSGTNSLPAFMAGPPDHNHSALLQQMQSKRAVENDYSEHPGTCATFPIDIEAASRIARTSHAGSSRSHRRDHESSSRTRNNREEGTHPAFRESYLTTSDRRRGRHRPTDFDTPPPRPPLSRFHLEHRPGRVLRVSSSLPASFGACDSVLVPMAHNPASSSHFRRERTGRHRTPETIGHTAPRRGFSLTPPPVCRANKPRYDVNNRLIQTVSSPSVVTHCVESGIHHSCRMQSQRICGNVKTQQPTKPSFKSPGEKSQLFQPSHVAVISQQPRKKSKKKLVDEDDEIARQKKGLVVSLNNNVTKSHHALATVQSKEDVAPAMSSISPKVSDDCSLKKQEETPMLCPDTPLHHDSRSDPDSEDHSTRCRVKSGDINYTCPRCGKCRHSDRLDPDPRPDESYASHCWLCNRRCLCLCNVDSCVEKASCLCCVRGLFYHCSNYEDNDMLADKPCSCQSDKCCMRWTLLGALSICFPCLLFYPVARGCAKLCRTCSSESEQDCQCKNDYR